MINHVFDVSYKKILTAGIKTEHSDKLTDVWNSFSGICAFLIFCIDIYMQAKEKAAYRKHEFQDFFYSFKHVILLSQIKLLFIRIILRYFSQIFKAV